MNNKFILLILLFCFNCFGTDMKKEKDSQKLFDSALTMAQLLIKEQGEFLPFGEVINSAGEQVSVSATNEDELPNSTDLIKLLKSYFQESAEASGIIASALVYDVRIKSGDAIAIDLDHESGYSVTILVPYDILENKLVLGEKITVEGKGLIF